MRSQQPATAPQDDCQGTSPTPPPLDVDTARRIVAMIDDRRKRIDSHWSSLERGTQESWGVLMKAEELSNLKWAIVDLLTDQGDSLY